MANLILKKAWKMRHPQERAQRKCGTTKQNGFLQR